MSIITKPSSVQKNQVAQFTLSKSNLALVSSVSSDSYFSNSTNWKEVIIIYKSSVGNQKEILKFDATLASPTANFLVSNKARNIFQVQKIVIKDFDNGLLEIKRNQLTTSDFDIDFSASSSNGAITWNIANKTGTGTVTLGSNGGITKTSVSGGYNVNVLSTQTITGDGYVEFTYSSIFLNVVFGVATTNSISGSYNEILLGTFVAGFGGFERVQSGIAYGGVISGGSGATNGDIIRIGRTGTNYYIKRNGTTIYQTTINNTNILKASISIYSQNSGIIAGTF